MPQNFARCRQIPFVALTGNFLQRVAKRDKLCSQVDRKRRQLCTQQRNSHSLSLSVSIFLLQRLQVAAQKFADPFRAILYALKHAFVKSKFYGLVTLLPRQHDKLKQLHGIRASRVQFFHFYGLPTSWELQLWRAVGDVNQNQGLPSWSIYN